MAEVFDGRAKLIPEPDDFSSVTLCTDRALKRWLAVRVFSTLSDSLRRSLMRGTPRGRADRDVWTEQEAKGRRIVARRLLVILGRKTPAGIAERDLARCGVFRLSQRLFRTAESFLAATESSEAFYAWLADTDLDTRMVFVKDDGQIEALPCATLRLWHADMPKTVSFRSVVRSLGIPEGFAFHGTNYRPSRSGAPRQYLRIEEAARTVAPPVALALGEFVKSVLQLAAEHGDDADAVVKETL